VHSRVTRRLLKALQLFLHFLVVLLTLLVQLRVSLEAQLGESGVLCLVQHLLKPPTAEEEGWNLSHDLAKQVNQSLLQSAVQECPKAFPNLE
jgi:hypothetical protein